MKYRVVILPRAEADIEATAQWWAEHHSLERAERWFDAIYDQLKSMADTPEINGLSAEKEDFPYEIRDKLVGIGSRPSYRAVFTVKENTVYVLTVRRASQDVLRSNDVEPPTAL